jgi:tartrate-resistant acid phosphatase type 5
MGSVCESVKYLFFLPFVLLSSVTCSKLELIDPVGFETSIEADSVIFAEIGDFGWAGTPEEQVAELVKSWNPDFIISAGDNNYVEGKLSTIHENITQYYGDYIYNYDAPAEYQCNGKAFEEGLNRFFPTPGNHDANNRDELVPYYNFFTLPENEVYYMFTWGPVTFYSINSIEGNLSEQRAWLGEQLLLSISPFNIVFTHMPPYSSGAHGNHESMQWDFYSMGVDVVFTGHDHIYESIEIPGQEGMYYIVNGLGGRGTYTCAANPLSEDLFRTFCYNDDFGALKGIATNEKLILEFYSVSSSLVPIDRIEILD